MGCCPRRHLSAGPAFPWAALFPGNWRAAEPPADPHQPVTELPLFINPHLALGEAATIVAELPQSVL